MTPTSEIVNRGLRHDPCSFQPSSKSIWGYYSSQFALWKKTQSISTIRYVYICVE